MIYCDLEIRQLITGSTGVKRLVSHGEHHSDRTLTTVQLQTRGQEAIVLKDVLTMNQDDTYMSINITKRQHIYGFRQLKSDMRRE